MASTPPDLETVNPKIALVTGASGFIGRHLVDALIGDGYEVRALSRSGIDSEQVQNVLADITDSDAIAKAMVEVDVVFHLAGVGSPATSQSQVEEMYRVNVVGTHNILHAATEAGVRRVIIASSAAVYGAIDSDAISEDSPLKPTSPYGLTKVAQERACEMYSRMHGLETFALRLFNVYGPGEDLSEKNCKFIPSVYRKLLADEPVQVFGDGQQTRDFVFIDDVVKATRQSADIKFHGHAVVNIGTGQATSIDSVINQLAATILVTPKVDVKPARSGEIRHSIADTTISRAAGINCATMFAVGVQQFAKSGTEEQG